jgi:hypothetical protein
LYSPALSVKLLGVEKIKWTDKAPSSRGQPAPTPQQAHHPRFRQVLNILTTPEVLNIGLYTYPFSFELPSALPGVFTMKTSASDADGVYAGMIRYTIDAILDISGSETDQDTIMSRDVLVVHEKFMGKPRVRHESTKQTIRFGLFSKGECHVGASIARDVYYPGQTVHVKWEMSTSDGNNTIAVKELHSRLLQVLNITLGFQSKRICSRYITKTYSKGLPPAKNIVHYQPLPLVSASEGFVSPTTTTGSNLMCRYLLELECKLDGARENIVMRIPIKIIGHCVQCPGLVVTEQASDDGLMMALRSSSLLSR